MGCPPLQSFDVKGRQRTVDRPHCHHVTPHRPCYQQEVQVVGVQQLFQ